MEFDFEKTQRTVWLVSDRVEFFDKMLSLLNIDEQDILEIKKELRSPNFDYVEVASYLPEAKQEDPDAVLVFDGKKDVYWDIFNAKKSSQIIQKIQLLAGTDAKISHKRGLTQRDWRKRFEVLQGL